MSGHHIGILVFDGLKMLDLSGPAEVFSEANQHGADYRLSIVSADGKAVRSSIGMTVPVDLAAGESVAFDTVLIAGGDRIPQRPVDQDLADAARTLAARAGRVASICTGAFILGAAGLLDGKRATTHWRHTTELARRHPSTQVEPDAIYVRDGTTYSSAGVTAGIDLALALLEEDRGPDITRLVAQSLVVYMQRAGGQSQFSASLQGPVPQTPVLRLVMNAVQADPAADHSLPALANRVHVSERHLTRMFRAELDTTPTKYVELIRFDLAKALLDSGRNATEAAEAAGFPSYEALRRAFARHLGISPTRYQQRFRTSRVDQA
ncbi:GlxA family transcriptional regulator [Kribbella sp. CA-253562]|uniref:GlxA family transcriptional regulator n=1 Tax=Kribbella sp. CA-253562 TaxID=3239942 RepID=UPI003D8CBA48